MGCLPNPSTDLRFHLSSTPEPFRPPRTMRPPRLLTFALVRDPRLPHLLRGLLGDLWLGSPTPRRRLMIATSGEELYDIERGDVIETVLVELRDAQDMLRVSAALDAAPTARVIAIPSTLLLTPEGGDCPHSSALEGMGASVLDSLDEAGLRQAVQYGHRSVNGQGNAI